MNRARLAAAAAALITVLLLQATVVGPALLPVPVSLPALLVAVVALTDGPGVGLAFGFATGLVADLASEHPAGVLALAWLALGLMCGRWSARPTVRRTRRTEALIAAAATALVTAGTQVVYVLLAADGATLGATLRLLVPAALLDLLLALLVVTIVRPLLTGATLRAARPILVLGQNA